MKNALESRTGTSAEIFASDSVEASRPKHLRRGRQVARSRDSQVLKLNSLESRSSDASRDTPDRNAMEIARLCILV